ncbi:MAG: tetratricopeptide repeat protein [Halioglobus sp.]
MTRTGPQQLHGVIQQISAVLTNNPRQAELLCEKAMAQIGEEPNLLHLQGLALSRMGQVPAAIISLQKSIALSPSQPEVLNNLGNFFKKSGLLEEAETHYKSALELKPDFGQASKNLGLVLLARRKYQEARSLFTRLVEVLPNDVSLLTALGNAERLMEQYDRAVHCYEKALAINPNYVNALHNIGLSHKLAEQPAVAILYYDRALKLAPDIAEIHLNKGNAEFELTNYEAAEQCYRQAIALDPSSVLAHETLSELLWQTGATDDLTSSLDAALLTDSANLQLHTSKAKLLIHCQDFLAAGEALNMARIHGSSPALHQLAGQLLANQGRFPEAAAEFEKALGDDFLIDIVHDLVRTRIAVGDYQKAEALLQQCIDNEPDNQLNWGLISLCWRLMGDPRYDWLINYERDVQVFTLETPPGYGSLEEFLEELRQVLLSMHTTKNAPTRQTLVSGTQTPGRLLHKQHPVIQAYRWSLAQSVRQYILTMPDDPSHPLFRRKSEEFEFSGSWSVKLGPGGYHVNHVHPAGWISSACYIHIPEGMGSNDTNEGCLKFGEGPLLLGAREKVERVIRPECGKLALFPSYAWHGTYNIQCDESDYRLTAPFDVVPA